MISKFFKQHNMDINIRKYDAKESNLHQQIRITACIWLVDFSSVSSILPPKGTYSKKQLFYTSYKEYVRDVEDSRQEADINMKKEMYSYDTKV